MTIFYDDLFRTSPYWFVLVLNKDLFNSKVKNSAEILSFNSLSQATRRDNSNICFFLFLSAAVNRDEKVIRYFHFL
jgi:hypothetical protein